MKLKIRKFVFYSFLIFTMSFGLQAQNVIRYFIDMPAYLLPSMENTHKLELIENYQGKKAKDTIENLFGGKVKILELDTVAELISIRTTSVSRFEMMVFENENDTLIGIINTVCGPVCSSYIRFYNKKWKEIKVDFPKLSNSNWLKLPESKMDGGKVEDVLKGSFLEYTFSPSDKSVKVVNNSIQMLGQDEQTLVEPHLEENVVSVKWNNKKWEVK